MRALSDLPVSTLILLFVATLLTLAHPRPSWAASVVAVVPVAGGPEGIAVNAVTNKIYVSNSSYDTVAVIDGSTNAATSISDLSFQGPDAVAVDTVTNLIYVTNTYFSNSISVINGMTNAVQATINDASYDGLYSIAVDSTTNRIYVANLYKGTVSVINGATNARLDVIPVGNFPEGIAVNEKTDKVYVANQSDNTVTAIDGAKDTTSTITDASFSYPRGIAVNPSTNLVYVANEGTTAGQSLTVIDGATTSVIAAIPARLGSASSLAVDPSTNLIYIATEGSEIVILDGYTDALATFTDPSLQTPWAVAVDSSTSTLYSVNFSGESVSVIASPASSAPAVTSVSPVSGSPAGGTFITITGSGFNTNGGTTIAVGAHQATGVSCISSTQCTAYTPGGVVTQHVTAAVAGQFSAVSAADLFEYPIAAGDVNGDGAIDSQDALCVLRIVAALVSTPACPIPAPGKPDVNNDLSDDGSAGADATDALCILRYVAAMPSTQACPPFATASVVRQNLAAVAGRGSGVSSTHGEVSLSLQPGKIARTGQRETVDVTASAGSRLGSWTVDVAYDPSTVSAVTCTQIGGSICNAGFSPGTIRIAGAAAAGLSGAQTLARISFERHGSLRKTDPLSIASATLTDANGAPLSIVAR